MKTGLTYKLAGVLFFLMESGAQASLILEGVGNLTAEGVDISNTLINTTTEAETIFELWAIAGKPATGGIGSGYTVGASGTSMVSQFDVGGSSGDFSPTNPYPGGVGGDDFLVRLSGVVQLAAGDYTLFVQSDDGFSLLLATIAGDVLSFSKKFGNGAGQGAANELRFENPTGNSNTGGQFTLSQDSIFGLTGIFFERTGEDFFEVGIAPLFTTSAPPGNGYVQFAHNALDGDVTFAKGFISVPEPASLALFGLGLAGIGYQRRRRLMA